MCMQFLHDLDPKMFQNWFKLKVLLIVHQKCTSNCNLNMNWHIDINDQYIPYKIFTHRFHNIASFFTHISVSFHIIHIWSLPTLMFWYFIRLHACTHNTWKVSTQSYLIRFMRNLFTLRVKNCLHGVPELSMRFKDSNHMDVSSKSISTSLLHKLNNEKLCETSIE